MKPLEAGERVLLQDVKGRRYLITLEQGATFHTHKGRLAHDQLLGSAEGVVARTDLGQKLLVLRPTLADWVVKMPRGAQVIYPKVLALMVMAADVQPGLTVAEAGAGSGALSIALLQALTPGGRLHSFERRPDFADQARRNLERWFGKAPDGFQLHEGDVVDGIAGLGPVDRVLLDLLEPWLVVPGAAAALRPGGVLVSFVATVLYLVRRRWELSVEAGRTPTRFPVTLGSRLPATDVLDRMAYRTVAFGFPVYTFGIIAGAIWAEAAWGRYWGWDPKETWAFIAWVVYAAYLHARTTAGWRGRPAAWVNVVGLVVMIFNLLFVNMVSTGLHSYAGV